MYGLITGMTELVAEANALPSYYGLWLLPAQVANGRCCIGNATEYEHAVVVGTNTLHLTTLDGQHGAFVAGSRASQQSQHRNQE